MAGAAAVGLGKSCLGDEVREAGLHPENKVLTVSTCRWGVEGDNEAGSSQRPLGQHILLG